MKNKTLTKTVMTLALLFSTATAATAQEYIKEVDNLPGDATLVREYKNDKRVICSSRYDSTTFVMVTEGGTMAPYITINEDVSVNDMEVYGDTLYFCGAIYRGSLEGYIGYIDLAAFPATSVRLTIMSDLQSCNKLEVMRSCYDNRMHIIATATEASTKTCLVDFVRANYPGWNYYKSTGDSPERVYNDVAVTDQYVVVTVRDFKDSLGYIYYLDHPTPGNHIFYGSLFEAQVYTGVMSSILIESQQADKFITVCKDKVNLGIVSPFVFDVASFNGYTPLARKSRLCGDNPGINTNHAIDLKYNEVDEETDLLVNCQYNGYRNSLIYHIDTTVNIVGRLYNQQDIRSLDFLRRDPVHFIASGFSYRGELWFYKYMPKIWNNCSERFSEDFIHVLWDLRTNPKKLGYESMEPFLSLTIQHEGEKEIYIKCPDGIKEEEK